MFWLSITNIHFFFSSQNAKDRKIRNCATAPGDFLNHTHFASCYSLQQQNITKATERILAAENYDNSKYRISFVCRSEINAMSLKGILKNTLSLGHRPNWWGPCPNWFQYFFKGEKGSQICAQWWGPPCPTWFWHFFILTTFKTEILCVWGVLGFLP